MIRILLKIANVLVVILVLLYFITYETLIVNETKPSKDSYSPAVDQDYIDRFVVRSNHSFTSNDFIMELSKNRLKKLFKILLEKEKTYSDILNGFDLISFSDLKKQVYRNYQQEIKKYLSVENDQIDATDSFVEHINQMSINRSFIYSDQRLRKLVPKTLNPFEIKPVIVTAAHSGYFNALEASILTVHRKFPGWPIIIYDLGLTRPQLRMVKQNCKCQVRKFDKDNKYIKKSEHIKRLKTYAWKPLIIQEVLNNYQTVLYIDSSIYFNTDHIGEPLATAKSVGMFSQTLTYFNLTDYTNPKMFEWFDHTHKDFENMATIEANILIFNRCFITSLIMKTWVTCALDVNCIDPVGSRLMGCPGCHRYDQDALTIAISYFYGFPKQETVYLPASSFLPPLPGDKHFFSVLRGQSLKFNQHYFIDNYLFFFQIGFICFICVIFFLLVKIKLIRLPFLKF